MSRTDGPSAIEEHREELEAEAERNDAPAGIVVLAAIARDEEPPKWAAEELGDG